MKKRLKSMLVPLLSISLTSSCSNNNFEVSNNNSSSIISESIQTNEESSTVTSNENSLTESLSENSSQTIKALNLNTLNGSFKQTSNTSFRSLSNSSLGIFEDNFKNISISCDITIGGVSADNGIIFSASFFSTSSPIWEGTNISYYFYFVSRSGTAYLGKTNNGNWSILFEKPIPNFSINESYTLKVSRIDDFIYCYLGDEVIGAYCDSSPLNGTAFGLRASSDCALFTNISYSENNNENNSEELVDYSNVSGEFVKVSGAYIPVSDNSLMISDKVYSQFKSTIKTFIPTSGDNGIAFGYNDNSYMYYCVNSDKSVSLYKISNGISTLIKNTSLVAKYGNGAAVNLSVIVENDKVYTYIDDVCLITSDYKGTGKIGLKSSSKGIIFDNYQNEENASKLKADIVIWGHSHTQLWDNYKTDLDGYGKVVNMGIGGSDTPYWGRLIEEITSYEADTFIVMTGSNDIPNRDVDFIMEQEDIIFKQLLEVNPNLKIILISEFLQPCRLDYGDKVRELNARYFEYEDKNPFITIVDAYDIALNKDGTLNNSIFRDIYHLTTEGYDILKVRIRQALNGNYNFPKENRYHILKGSLVFEDNNIITSTNETLAINKGLRLKRGYLYGNVNLSTKVGLIFAYSDNSYYKALVSNSEITLTKVVNNNETILNTVELTTQLGNHNLKVYYKDGEIKVYLNELEVLSFTDTSPLKGELYGFYLDGTGNSISNLSTTTVEGDYVFPVGEESKWDISTDSNGNKVFKSLSKDQLLMFKDITFDGGIIEFDMQVNAIDSEHAYTVANGIVFGATSLNINHSDGKYYVFGRCPLASMTGFSKNEGAFRWEDTQKGLFNIPIGSTQHYKFEWDKESNMLYMYINDNLTASNPLVVSIDGNHVGIYCSSANTIISNLTFTNK